MKTATWVIQSNQIKTSQVLPLVEALQRLGEPFVDVGVDTVSGLMAQLDPAIGDNIIPYGSTHLVKVAQAYGWRHLYFDEATFNVASWSRHHSQMLNPDAQVMTLADAKRRAADRAEWFVRPVGDLKPFAGLVLTADEIVKWVERLEAGDCEIDGSEWVALSAPKVIQMEWRYFVIDGRIATGSSYQLNGRPYARNETDQSVLSEAQDLADIWLPLPCCCMDVALSGDKAYVVEFNTINASGFYDHDIELFAALLSDYARRR